MTFTVSHFDTADSIEGCTTIDGIPFVFAQVKIIIRIHYGELTLCKRYLAEGIAVSNPAIQQYRPDKYPDEPDWNVNGEPNFPAPQREFRS